jgi:hypothetical protein
MIFENGLNFVVRYEYSRKMRPSKSNKKKVTEVVEPVQEETAVVVPPKKKGANKKPVKIVAVVTPQGIEGSFQAEPRRPLIVHLGIRPADITFHAEEGAEPQPYDASTHDVFSEAQEPLEQLEAAAAAAAHTKKVTDVPAAAEPVEAKPMPCFTKMNLMVQFKDVHEAKKLPEKTDIACFWCVHPFGHQPCIIPEREVNGIYNVYGNFCSPECGVAYLLKEGIDPHVRWERMALLHRVYDQQGIGQIFPAPARECLNVFGGPMSIDVFRATLLSKKVRVDLHMPPMVSILGSIDTKPIDFFDSTSKATGLPVLPQRSVEEGLRLKRSKPLKDKESTLDTVMNIKIGGFTGLSR